MNIWIIVRSNTYHIYLSMYVSWRACACFFSHMNCWGVKFWNSNSFDLFVSKIGLTEVKIVEKMCLVEKQLVGNRIFNLLFIQSIWFIGIAKVAEGRFYASKTTVLLCSNIYIFYFFWQRSLRECCFPAWRVPWYEREKSGAR